MLSGLFQVSGGELVLENKLHVLVFVKLRPYDAVLIRLLFF